MLRTGRVRFVISTVVLAAAVGLSALIGALLMGKLQTIYQSISRVTGTSNDMGRVNFATLQRRATPNDALLCPPRHCLNAKPDWEAPTFAATPADLLARVATIALAEPSTGMLHQGPGDDFHHRFVQYSRIMRFPDTIDVEAIPVGDDKSTLAIYSRSLVGRYDFGVNRARIARWLAALEKTF
jgi:uncharacterized protein (DUF1499 family)